MLYKIIKNLIEHNYYEKEDMTNKLNVFMLVSQITQDEYLELLALITPVELVKDTKPIEDIVPITKEENTEVVAQ